MEKNQTNPTSVAGRLERLFNLSTTKCQECSADTRLEWNQGTHETFFECTSCTWKENVRATI